ncbi:TetR/AcrR family transcriptional regulator [Lentibacillus halophilus]|uniref:TetR/AcrR family transcriptional regulator n=1 Tax=Lentibacillus halophilus TaxID=295065 RepID=A0ABP3J3L0_9BACI
MKLTETKIRENALKLFIQKGINDTSLSDIGEEVGIKKQSIYTHFKNKNELILTVMNQVVQEEVTFLNDYFDKSKDHSLYEILYNFINKLKSRFISHGEENIKFLLRMMFLPPNNIENTVIVKAFTFYNQIQSHIEETITSHQQTINIEAEKAKLSYMNLFDGLLVELVYVNIENFEYRFQHSWDIYWRGITQ